MQQTFDFGTKCKHSTKLLPIGISFFANATRCPQYSRKSLEHWVVIVALVRRKCALSTVLRRPQSHPLAQCDIGGVERERVPRLEIFQDIKIAWATKRDTTLKLLRHVAKEVSVGLAVVVFFDHFHHEGEVEVVMLQ